VEGREEILMKGMGWDGMGWDGRGWEGREGKGEWRGDILVIYMFGSEEAS
jgi:hypothetical protein